MTITNLTHDIRITYGVGHERTIDKLSIQSILIKNGDTIWIELSGDKNVSANPFIRLPYADVTSPVTTSIYQLRDLLIAYKNANRSAMADDTFTNGDLVGGVLLIAHNLGVTSVIIVIRDPNGLSQVMSDTYIDSNTCSVDFGGAIAAGTWTWFAIGLT